VAPLDGATVPTRCRGPRWGAVDVAKESWYVRAQPPLL